MEDEVAEKYYVNTPRSRKLIDDLIQNGKIRELCPDKLTTCLFTQKGSNVKKKIDVACALLARDYKGFSNFGTSGVICKTK